MINKSIKDNVCRRMIRLLEMNMYSKQNIMHENVKSIETKWFALIVIICTKMSQTSTTKQNLKN